MMWCVRHLFKKNFLQTALRCFKFGGGLKFFVRLFFSGETEFTQYRLNTFMQNISVFFCVVIFCSTTKLRKKTKFLSKFRIYNNIEQKKKITTTVKFFCTLSAVGHVQDFLVYYISLQVYCFLLPLFFSSGKLLLPYCQQQQSSLMKGNTFFMNAQKKQNQRKINKF